MNDFVQLPRSVDEIALAELKERDQILITTHRDGLNGLGVQLRYEVLEASHAPLGRLVLSNDMYIEDGYDFRMLGSKLIPEDGQPQAQSPGYEGYIYLQEVLVVGGFINGMVSVRRGETRGFDMSAVEDRSGRIVELKTLSNISLM